MVKTLLIADLSVSPCISSKFKNIFLGYIAYHMAVYIFVQDCLNFLLNSSVYYNVMMNLSFKNILFFVIFIPALFLLGFAWHIIFYLLFSFFWCNFILCVVL